VRVEVELRARFRVERQALVHEEAGEEIHTSAGARSMRGERVDWNVVQAPPSHQERLAHDILRSVGDARRSA
jgi:hypothetical protein